MTKFEVASLPVTIHYVEQPLVWEDLVNAMELLLIGNAQGQTASRAALPGSLRQHEGVRNGDERSQVIAAGRTPAEDDHFEEGRQTDD